jgi:TonB family protein
LLLVLAASIAGAKQTTSAIQTDQASSSGGHEKVYDVGGGVTVPELLSTTALETASDNCNDNQKGKVILSLVVNANGLPGSIYFVGPLGNDADKFALRAVSGDRFRPGTLNGAPVAVHEWMELNLNTCVEHIKDITGKKESLVRLSSQPEQKVRTLASPQPETENPSPLARAMINPTTNPPHVDRAGDWIIAPKPLTSPEANYTKEARKARITGICLVSVIVDAQGMPQNPRIIKSLYPGLDQSAIDAILRYRFKPAMKNGVEPVPVQITVEVNFQLYER